MLNCLEYLMPHGNGVAEAATIPMATVLTQESALCHCNTFIIYDRKKLMLDRKFNMSSLESAVCALDKCPNPIF